MNFSEKAKRANSNSPIIEGRTKISVKDIINDYKDGITITQFDMLIINNEAVPVFRYNEDDKRYFFGGSALTKICKIWLEEYNGDIERCSNDLHESGGIKVSFEYKTTKTGRNYVSVNIL